MSQHAGAAIVLTAPLTESIDHAGFFIQMSLASIPGWMEWVIDKKYPTWRAVPTTAEGRAGTAPAGLRVLEAVLAREFGGDEVVVCYPEQLPDFIGERTRVVAVSTHNPLGTTFAAVEMTTGCGRRCAFCQPDLNPRISVPKAPIMDAVRANVAAGNRQISLATEDMFVWRTDEAGLPFFVPNRTELLDLYRSIVDYPGVEQITLSHATIAPALVDPDLIEELSAMLLDRSPIRLKAVSTHPEHRALSPLIGIETGSVRIARKIMAGQRPPFGTKDWPPIVFTR